MKIEQELQKLFGKRKVMVQDYIEPPEFGFRASLQCVPYDPMSIAECHVGDGQMRDEPGMSGPDEGEDWTTIIQTNGTYFAHWLPETGQVDVYIKPNDDVVAKRCFAAIRNAVSP